MFKRNEAIDLNTVLAGRDLLRLLDLTPQEVALILKTAAEQKAAWKSGIHESPLTGTSVAIILEKPSFRTRSSFEIGAARLGAHPLVMADDHSAFSRGEPVKDTACILSRFCECIVLRTFEQSKVEELAQWADVPVINALTDDYHPCQVLADLLTIQEHLGDVRNLTMAYVGDGNNMSNTYLEAGALTGMNVKVCTPAGYEVSAALFDECVAAAQKYGTGAELTQLHDPLEVVKGANIVVTDTWTSMGSEAEHDARLKAFGGFQVTDELMKHAAKDAIFMHCLPAHRGEEVTDEVMGAPYSAIYDEAENRLHAQKAVMSLVMGVPASDAACEYARSLWGDVL
ncbi:MAG: ornithine carbamoyltransferase [Coriobacteriales bacterium]|nr:ornithine carbamoyltransferase [Coriobacteriales bacterium]